MFQTRLVTLSPSCSNLSHLQDKKYEKQKRSEKEKIREKLGIRFPEIDIGSE